MIIGLTISNNASDRVVTEDKTYKNDNYLQEGHATQNCKYIRAYVVKQKVESVPDHSNIFFHCTECLNANLELIGETLVKFSYDDDTTTNQTPLMNLPPGCPPVNVARQPTTCENGVKLGKQFVSDVSEIVTKELVDNPLKVDLPVDNPDIVNEKVEEVKVKLDSLETQIEEVINAHHNDTDTRDLPDETEKFPNDVEKKTYTFPNSTVVVVSRPLPEGVEPAEPTDTTEPTFTGLFVGTVEDPNGKPVDATPKDALGPEQTVPGETMLPKDLKDVPEGFYHSKTVTQVRDPKDPDTIVELIITETVVDSTKPVSMTKVWVKDLVTPPVGKTNPEDGTETFPDGTVKHPDGTTTNPDGTTTHPDGTTTNPDGSPFEPGTKPGTEPKEGEEPEEPEEPTKNPDGTLTYPDGTVVDPEGSTLYPDGTVVDPNGQTVFPDGAVRSPDGSTTEPDGTLVQPDGTTTYPDGTVRKPNGTVEYPDEVVKKPDGTLEYPDGAVKKPDGTTLMPDESVRKPDGTVEYPDGSKKNPEGVKKNPDGTLEHPDGTVEKPDGTKENPNGTTTKPDGSTENPNGTTTDPEGVTTNPDGSVKEPVTKPDGITENPDGSTTDPEGVTTYPNGTTVSPDGTTENPNGTTTDPEGVTKNPDGTPAGVTEDPYEPREDPPVYKPRDAPTPPGQNAPKKPKQESPSGEEPEGPIGSDGNPVPKGTPTNPPVFVEYIEKRPMKTDQGVDVTEVKQYPDSDTHTPLKVIDSPMRFYQPPPPKDLTVDPALFNEVGDVADKFVDSVRELVNSKSRCLMDKIFHEKEYQIELVCAKTAADNDEDTNRILENEMVRKLFCKDEPCDAFLEQVIEDMIAHNNSGSSEEFRIKSEKYKSGVLPGSGN